ncbi:calcium-binding protein [Methylosoma difficile]
MAELIGAGLITEYSQVFGGALASYYLGSVVASAAVATGRVLSGGTSLADVFYDVTVLDKQAYKLHNNGLFNDNQFNQVMNLASGLMLSSGSLSSAFQNYNFGLTFNTPIGAFYDSQSTAYDTSASIANLTPVLLDAGNGNSGLSVALLNARDSNGDGQLAGSETNSLVFWSDANEDGKLDAGETQALSALGIAVASADYGFYTRGNDVRPSEPLQPTLAAVAAPASPADPVVPDSRYRYLRDNDNAFFKKNAYGQVFVMSYSSSDVKVSKDEQYIVGTDGADSFGLSFLRNSLFDPQKVIGLLGGGGDDFIRGTDTADLSWAGSQAKLNDTIWGGDGNDTALGYAGDDSLYGEAGDDFLLGGSNNDLVIGGIGNDYLWGDEDSDTLYGGDGADQLVGDTGYAAATTGGVDSLYGGLGDDTLFGERGADNLFGGAGNDELQGGFDNDKLSGEDGNDRLFGQTGDDTVWGGEGNDVLVGFTASNETKQTLLAGETDNDILYGDGGNDNLFGDWGNDTLDGGSGNDLIDGGVGNDKVFGSGGNDQLTGGDGNDQLLGGAGEDKLFGETGNDKLWGGDGDDMLMGFTASNTTKQTLAVGETDDDWLYGGNGNDLMIAGLGNDNLFGEAGVDELQGGDGNDKLYGGAGDDHLFGQVGNDVLYGGDGDDVLVGFTASNESKQSLVAGESDNDWLYGGAGQDLLLGSEGNDYLDGGAGADDMQGGNGSDVYIVNSVNDSIAEAAGAGYDTVISSCNYLLNQNIEKLRLLDGLSIHGTGNALDNKIIGNNEDNILDGVTGADTLIGEKGDDTYYVDNVGDQVVEQAGEGLDRVQSSISYTLAENAEDLVLLDFSKPESGLVDGAGVLVYGYPKRNELDYSQGDALADYLGTCALTAISNIMVQAGKPSTEADIIQLAINNDWALSDPNLPAYERGGSTSADQQAILDSLGLRNDLLSGYREQGLANLVMSGRAVILGVNAGKLWGEPDYIDGGAVNHAITITGAVYNNSGDANQGQLMGFFIADSGRRKVNDMNRFVAVDTLKAAANVPGAYAIYTLEPLKLWDEDLTGTGNAGDNTLIGNRGNNNLSGGDGNDSLSGGAGNDNLVGGAGADSMNGGEGDDVFMVDNTSDTVKEAADEGFDIVRSSVSFTIKAYVEQLELLGSGNINGTGSALSDLIIGNDGNNVLNGGGDVDELRGGLGDDTYVVNKSQDLVVENANEGNDSIQSVVSYVLPQNVDSLTLTGNLTINGTGNALNNTLVGNAAANILNGGTGADVLIGGLGNDRLLGGAGADIFRFDAMLADNVDTLSDFSVTDDIIELDNAVFSKLTTLGALSSGRFVNAPSAADANDYIVYNSSSGALYYDADGNGVQAAVQIAQMGTGLAMSHLDFVVI